jgi:hypothetical protein
MATITSNAYYGRKWHIVYNPANGAQSLILTSSDFGDYALRATFKRDIPGYQAISYCDITIWNLNAETDSLITSKTKGTVLLQAGYENGAYGNIFTGAVFQIVRGRENVTDYFLTLHCMDGMGIMNNSTVSFTTPSPINQRTALTNIAAQATIPFELAHVSADLSDISLPRGKVFFGEPKRYLRQIAQDNLGQFFVDDTGVTVSKITDAYSGNIVTVSPSTGLIGYPQQIDWGVQVKCLLNPNLTVSRPAMQIKIDQSFIRQELVQYGHQVSVLDQDGQYMVARVTHTGDTRGNDWYTEVTGVSSTGRIPYLPGIMQNVNQNPNH